VCGYRQTGRSGRLAEEQHRSSDQAPLANSVFIIVFDESLDVDLVNGGGKVAWVMVGSHVKSGFKSTTFYQHQSTLRLVMDLLRVSDHPGNSATTPAMQEFFQ
jgi:hypothetical protein